MFVTQATAHEVEGARAALVVLALGIVFFWRTAVRVLLAIVLVAIVAGVLLLLQGMHR
jgi:RsiW-degrading membrane proteinase PrsW (M82 family)